MPPWANLGTRHESVRPTFDVYMLGKLLWSMIDGRPILPREYQQNPSFDLTDRFPNDPHMYLMNQILGHCVVEQENRCLSSAKDLLVMVESALAVLERGGQLLRDGVPRPCRVCGQGFYQPQGEGDIRLWTAAPAGAGNMTTNFRVHPFVCDKCGHTEFFRLTLKQRIELAQRSADS
jgi:hypothetical protein